MIVVEDGDPEAREGVKLVMAKDVRRTLRSEPVPCYRKWASSRRNSANQSRLYLERVVVGTRNVWRVDPKV